MVRDFYKKLLDVIYPKPVYWFDVYVEIDGFNVEKTKEDKYFDEWVDKIALYFDKHYKADAFLGVFCGKPYIFFCFGRERFDKCLSKIVEGLEGLKGIRIRYIEMEVGGIKAKMELE